LGARSGNFTSQADFYETTPCKFCGDDTRRVVCSTQSCNHAFCMKERGICIDCAREKLGDTTQPPPPMTMYALYELRDEREESGFDDAIRLIEDGR
jgi:hypothetical protein